MSANMNNKIEQEILSSGAPCVIPKPTKPNDLNTKHDLNHKINDGSKKIQDDTDGSKKIQEKTSSSDPCDGDSSSQATQKSKFKWTVTLENQFNKAIQLIGVHRVTPKMILRFMNQKSLTKPQVASKLQKYRKNLKIAEEGKKKETMATSPEFSSTGGCINPQHSYNYNIGLGNNNLFNVQPGYGLGQSSSMMNNNAGLRDSLNYMNHRPACDLSQSGCNLFPGRGNIGFQNGMLPLNEEWRSIPETSQAPSSGQYGTTSNGLGINYNRTGSNNYAGIKRDENRYLVGHGGIRVNGNDSFSGVRVHGTGSGSLQRMGSVHGNGYGSLGGARVHDTVNGYGSFGGVKVHGSGNSYGFSDGIRAHGNSNSNDFLSGIRVHGTGSVGGTRVHGTDTGYVGGVNVHGTSNGHGSLGMNWNFNNNMSSHGSSTPMFPYALSSFLDSKDQSQNNLIAQNGGVVPALENPNLFNDHHDINEVFSDTNNYQFHQNQHQGNLTRENIEAPTAYPLEDISSWSFSDGTNNEEMLNSFAVNPEMYVPTQDMNITNQGNNHEEILNPLAANPEMYFPTQDMNITNQDHDDEDFLNSLLDPDMN